MSEDFNLAEPNLILARDNSAQNILERSPDKRLETSTTALEQQNENIEGLPSK